ncbi:MAG TPA: RiPP maturation radical SAM C-methyltransferase [Candidatus Angelobacter sp.]|jgi:ribosomal peptide maturation radical SAM protein 1|nr:RiPP maturation radical SAM C-methyltransferase [Candidatus Angelobacter sp.]
MFCTPFPSGKTDAIIIVPPFAGIDRPCLAAHLLQACAKDRGIDVSVVYASLMFAREIGEAAYSAISNAPTFRLIGESFFAALAFDRNPFSDSAFYLQSNPAHAGSEIDFNIPLKEIQRLQEPAVEWVEQLATGICASGAPIVGCTTAFEQTAASVAILRAIKARNPRCITLLGGSNCEGEMAEGIAKLKIPIDFIFSGESEITFPQFLEEYRRNGALPATRIIRGQPCMDLDSLPTPEFREYFEQLAMFLPDSEVVKQKDTWLPFQTSRGCWWGEKQHCTFCGINGEVMSFRERKPSRVVTELHDLSAKYRSKRVFMVDNIMPYSYFNTLVPQLAESPAGLQIFYEQKANLSLAKVVALRQAGITLIQPGIEAFSTDLLKLMRKGVTTRQNLNLLRYARSAEISVSWNMLYAFPGDQIDYYAETLKFIPLLRHLSPPTGVHHLSMDRFSPYFNKPEQYGIKNLRPMAAYSSVFPPEAPLEQIAYHFVGDYKSGSRETPEVIRALTQEVERWKAAWDNQGLLPALSVIEMVPGSFMLLDTRSGIGQEKILFIDEAHAFVALVGGRTGALPEESVRWALENKVSFMLDGMIVPLAVAEPDLLGRFEAGNSYSMKSNMSSEQIVQIAQPS